MYYYKKIEDFTQNKNLDNRLLKHTDSELMPSTNTIPYV